MSGTINARLTKLNIELPQGAAPIANYVPYVISGNLVFVSGQVSRDAKSGEFVDGPFDDQFRRSIRNLEAILVAGGSSLDKVVKLTIYMLNQDDLDSMNRIIGEFFPDPPARSSFGVGYLWKKCKVQIDATAIVG